MIERLARSAAVQSALQALRTLQDFLERMHPAKALLLGYLSYVVAGWVLLSLPCMRHVEIKPLDNLFIATSAVSTTGLATVDVGTSYTGLGQAVILLLIQLGGVGYMTFSSFVVLSRKNGLGSRRSGVGQSVFCMPKLFRIDKFIRSVMKFTLAIELCGAVLLYLIFLQAGVKNPLWSAIFHSISAFCTAGFSLYSSSFESFAGNFWLNIVIAVLSYLGAVGFIVFVDVWRRLAGKVQHVTLTTKIILYASFWMTIIGTVAIFLSESSISGQADERLLRAFFQTMTAMTTVGFNTISFSGLAKATLLLITVLMVIGASPSGTGGGLKTTTLSAIIGVMRSSIRGSDTVTFWGRPIPQERVHAAIAGAGLYATILAIGAFLLMLTETAAFQDILFEAASALGTVGLSTGITASLTHCGKLIIIILMIAGRLGPLTFGMALFLRPAMLCDSQDNDIAV